MPRHLGRRSSATRMAESPAPPVGPCGLRPAMAIANPQTAMLVTPRIAVRRIARRWAACSTRLVSPAGLQPEAGARRHPPAEKVHGVDRCPSVEPVLKNLNEVRSLTRARCRRTSTVAAVTPTSSGRFHRLIFVPGNRARPPRDASLAAPRPPIAPRARFRQQRPPCPPVRFPQLAGQTKASLPGEPPSGVDDAIGND